MEKNLSKQTSLRVEPDSYGLKNGKPSRLSFLPQVIFAEQVFKASFQPQPTKPQPTEKQLKLL